MVYKRFIIRYQILSISYKKKQWRPPSKKKKKGKNLSPRNRKACHSISSALNQSVTEMRTQSAMKSSQKKCVIKYLTRKGSRTHQAKRKKQGGKPPTHLSPRNKEACHSFGTALMLNITKT
jgi:hypothetical protein